MISNIDDKNIYRTRQRWRNLADIPIQADAVNVMRSSSFSLAEQVTFSMHRTGAQISTATANLLSRSVV